MFHNLIYIYYMHYILFIIYNIYIYIYSPNIYSFGGHVDDYPHPGVDAKGFMKVINARNNVTWHEFVSIYPNQDGNIVMNIVPQTADDYAYLSGLEVVEA